jgi:hypothetical protein
VRAVTGLAGRLRWHGRMAWRASRIGIVLALVGGFLFHLVVPVRGAWLAGLVAAGCAILVLAFVGWAAARLHPLPPKGVTDVGASLEKVGVADQVAHGLARAASVLAAFYLGLWLGGLAS